MEKIIFLRVQNLSMRKPCFESIAHATKEQHANLMCVPKLCACNFHNFPLTSAVDRIFILFRTCKINVKLLVLNDIYANLQIRMRIDNAHRHFNEDTVVIAKKKNRKRRK